MWRVRDGADHISLDESRRWCAEVTRARAANFYWGLRLAPEDRRPDLYATYAWMRIADDIADGDEAQGGAAHQSRAERARTLDMFERATNAALDADVADAVRGANAVSGHRWTALWPAFVHACASHPIDRGWWAASLEGMREDLDHRGYASMSDLERYCYRVGSTVGLVCVAIWGLRRGASTHIARHAAIARGVSFQLTNILRDVGVDAALSPPRCYVPEAGLDGQSITHAHLLAWSRPQQCERVIRGMIDRAQALRRESMALDGVVNGDCLPVLRAMSNIYWRLLDKLDAQPSQAVAVPAIRVATIEKIGCVVGALWHGDDEKHALAMPRAERTP